MENKIVLFWSETIIVLCLLALCANYFGVWPWRYAAMRCGTMDCVLDTWTGDNQLVMPDNRYDHHKKP